MWRSLLASCQASYQASVARAIQQMTLAGCRAGGASHNREY